MVVPNIKDHEKNGSSIRYPNLNDRVQRILQVAKFKRSNINDRIPNINDHEPKNIWKKSLRFDYLNLNIKRSCSKNKNDYVPKNHPKKSLSSNLFSF